MANRYWVGGTATWNSTAGTKWSTTSGGGGGSAVPTAADDVFFDANSGAGTVTTSGTTTDKCRSINFTGFTGTFSHAASTTVQVGDGTTGHFTMVSGMTYTKGSTTTSRWSFLSTTTGNNITTGGKVLGNITFDGVGGAWTLQDALSADGSTSTTLTLTNGTLDTNGQTVSLGIFSSSNSNTRVLTLGASSITCSGVSTPWDITTSTNLTLNANTSTITLTGDTYNFRGGGKTYATVVLNISGSNALYGANTFGTLTITGAAVESSYLLLDDNQTITGTLTMNGNSATYRLLVGANGTGLTKTLTAATVSASYLNLVDITGAGAGSWNLSAITGLSGDCQGNSNITFTTGTNLYWYKNTGTWEDASKWFLASGGTGGAGRIPLPQDNVFFDANSFDTGSQQVDGFISLDLCKNMTWTGVTNSPVLNFNPFRYMYGSMTLSSGMQLNPISSTFVFAGRTACTLFSGGQTISDFGIGIDAPGGTLSLADNLTTTVCNFILYNGTFDLNNFNATLDNVVVQTNLGSNVLNLGSGTLTLSGTINDTVWNMGTVTVNAGTSTIKVVDTTGANVFTGGGQTYNNLWFDRGTNASSITINGSNTFAQFKDTGTVAHSILFGDGTTQTIADWQISGSSGQVVTINSVTTATHALVKSGTGFVSANYLNIQHSIATPATTWFAGTNSTNNQAVATAGSGWVFDTHPLSVSDQINTSESKTLEEFSFINKVDNITITESVTVSPVSVDINVVDNITITEEVTLFMFSGDTSVNVSDQINISENISINNSFGYTSVVDNITITESVSVVIVLAISVLDQITITENNTLLLSSSINVFDGITITESVSTSNPINGVSVVDNMSLSESVSVAILSNDLSLSVFDSITTTESTTLLLSVSINTSDQINLSESVNVTTVFNVSVSDSVSISEFIGYYKDTIIITESISVEFDTPPTLVISVNDQINISESIVLLLALTDISKSDQINISENVSIERISLINVADNITISESITLITFSFISVVDSITISESAVVSLLIADISKSDQINITEDVSLRLFSDINVFDSITITENLNSHGFYNVNVFDQINVSENIQISNPFLYTNVFDAITITEDTQVIPDEPGFFTINKNDTIQLSESISLLLEVTGIVVVDSITITENIQISNPLLYGNVFDSITITENTQASKEYTINVSDNIQIIENNTTDIQLNNIVVFDLITISESVNLGESTDRYITLFSAITISEDISIEIFRISNSNDRPLGTISRISNPIGRTFGNSSV